MLPKYFIDKQIISICGFIDTVKVPVIIPYGIWVYGDGIPHCFGQASLDTKIQLINLGKTDGEYGEHAYFVDDLIYAEAFRITSEFDVDEFKQVPVQQFSVGVKHEEIVSLDHLYTVVSSLTDIF